MLSAKVCKSRRNLLAALEPLEGRVFLSTTVITNATADNRGEAILTFNNQLNGADITHKSVDIYTAGPSGNPANSDHVQQRETVSYLSSSPGAVHPQLTVKTQTDLPPGTPYEIVLKSDMIQDINSAFIDGQFNPEVNGVFTASGNGSPGTKDFRFVTVGVKDMGKTAIFATQAGDMFVDLVPKSTAPNTIKNFLTYANAGVWDGTFFNRRTSTDADNLQIIQGGTYNLAGPRQLGRVPNLTNPSTGIPLETNTGLENVDGTIAMASTSVPNSATNTFFFNYGDNSSLNGNYAVFGQIPSGDVVSNAILNFLTSPDFSTVDLSSRQVVTSLGLPSGDPEFTEVPTDLSTGPSLTPGELASDLTGGLFFINRISIEMTPTAAVQTSVSNAPIILAAAPALFSQTPINDSTLTNDNIPDNTAIVGGSSQVASSSGTSTTTNTYVNGVLTNSSTTTTTGGDTSTGTLILTQSNSSTTVTGGDLTIISGTPVMEGGLQSGGVNILG